jgi:UDP-glucuronate 4-epimerase
VKKVLITGTAGFIGFHLARKLVDMGFHVTGLDIINDYYDVGLKYDRLEQSGISRDKIAYNQFVRSELPGDYSFIQLKLEDKEALFELFANRKFDVVVNLAAQAGVRYSLTHPQTYVDSNITGFLNILEACRHHPVENLIYASSSSVYGLNKNMPFSVSSNVDHPVSLYAASKKSNELMAHTYSHLFGVPTVGLRFFTVYGPWGRPDMALFLFTKAILDFTYVDDIVGGIERIVSHPHIKEENWSAESPDPSFSTAPYKLHNIGNSCPVKLTSFIETIEKALGKKAEWKMMPIQAGDVEKTWADVSTLERDYAYSPDTPVEKGIQHFIDWYRVYYQV